MKVGGGEGRANVYLNKGPSGYTARRTQRLVVWQSSWPEGPEGKSRKKKVGGTHHMLLLVVSAGTYGVSGYSSPPDMKVSVVLKNWFFFWCAILYCLKVTKETVVERSSFYKPWFFFFFWLTDLRLFLVFRFKKKTTSHKNECLWFLLGCRVIFVIVKKNVCFCFFFLLIIVFHDSRKSGGKEDFRHPLRPFLLSFVR